MGAYSREHYDLMRKFEEYERIKSPALEDKSQWARGNIYANGELNQRFLMFRAGYSLAKSIYQQEG